MKIKILIAEDHLIVRKGLQALLEKEDDLVIVGAARDGHTTVRLVQSLLPDVVLMDISMPDLNGIEATRQIVSGAPGVKVIALSMHSDRRFVQNMLSAGAVGYLSKDCAYDEMIEAIRAVMSEGIYLSPEITDAIVRDYLQNLSAENPAAANILSQKECEVLGFLAEGRSSKQIAAILNESEGRISRLRRQIMEKLNIHSLAGLTKYAVREG
ncbi:MAG: response regulator, partial [Calditrichia bacterium]